MGYLKVIESNTTWVCPKTATYKIICVASGNAGDVPGNPTSFGSYCTAFGSWNANICGYMFNDYGAVIGEAKTNAGQFGYGCGITISGYGAYEAGNNGGTGKLKVAISDIEKDTSVICTVGEAVSHTNNYETVKTSLPGVIVIQEIGEISGDISNNTEDDVEYTINLYRYTELYTTLKIKAGSPLILPSLPIYDESEYTGDAAHAGFTTSLGSNKVYNVNQTIFPIMDMNLYAGYSYKYIEQTVSAYSSVTVNAPGTCYLEVHGYQGSNGYVSIVHNGAELDHETSVSVQKGDTVSYIIHGSNLSVNIYYPRVVAKSWRSKL